MMNTVREEGCNAEDSGHEEYEYISHEEVMRVSERLMEQHMEALKALARGSYEDN